MEKISLLPKCATATTLNNKMATALNVDVELEIQKLTFRQQERKCDLETSDEEVILLRTSAQGDASLVSVSKGPSKLEKKLLNFSWHHVSAISTSLQGIALIAYCDVRFHCGFVVGFSSIEFISVEAG